MENSGLRQVNNIYASLPQSEKNQKLLDFAGQNKIKDLQLVLEAGAEIDSPRPNGDTALKVSAENGFTEMVDVLIQAGANLADRGVLSRSVKKNRLRTVTLLFSAMTQEQVDNEILQESITSTPSILATRTIPRYFEKYKQIVVTHRMSIFKNLGPLFLDENPENPFFHLPSELRELILLTYCLAQSNESWQHMHNKLDVKALYAAMNKNKMLTFSPKMARKEQRKLEESEILVDSKSKIEIIVEENKQPSAQKTKTRVKFHPRNYSPKRNRKSPQQSEDEMSNIEEAMSPLEISPKTEKLSKPKEKNARNKLHPQHYSPNILRRRSKHSDDEASLEEMMSQLEISPKEPKTKSKYNPLTFSPKLFRKSSKRLSESLSSEETINQVESKSEETNKLNTKKKSSYSFLRK